MSVRVGLVTASFGFVHPSVCCARASIAADHSHCAAWACLRLFDFAAICEGLDGLRHRKRTAVVAIASGRAVDPQFWASALRLSRLRQVATPAGRQ